MPVMQVALGPINERFGPKNITNSDLNPPDAFCEGVRLSDLVQEEDYVDVDAARAYLSSMPEGIHEAIRAVIYANLRRENPLPITFAWQPGYDWELTINDVASTDLTTGGITMIIRSRYPSDKHPLDGGGNAA